MVQYNFVTFDCRSCGEGEITIPESVLEDKDAWKCDNCTPDDYFNRVSYHD